MDEGIYMTRAKYVKVDIPDFHGSLNPEDLLDWRRCVERVFEFKGYTDRKAFKVVILKLKLRQQQQSVEIYLRNFEQLTLQCEIKEKYEQKIARFVEGLDPKIAGRVKMQQVWSFDKTVNLALRVEKMGKGKATVTKTPTRSPFYRPPTGIKIGESVTTTKPPVVDKGNATGQRKTIPMKKCFQCQAYGHFAKECPTKRSLSTLEVVQWEILTVAVKRKSIGVDVAPGTPFVPNPENKPESSGNQPITFGDASPALAVDKGRYYHKYDRAFRWMTFQDIGIMSPCSVCGFTFHAVVQAVSPQGWPIVASLKNFALLHVVLSWIDHLATRPDNSGSRRTTFMGPTVSFSIGKEYSDEVVCDVLPMDACPLLLGRPWEFDRDFIHQYVAPPGLIEHSKEVLLIGETEIAQELNSREVVLVLLVKGIAEEAWLPIPAEIVHLLRKYGDVFPEELSSGLPPLRWIEHHIDLIPGAVLPNKAAYRNEPRATQELQKQVGEIMNKGFNCQEII
ncbi:uncharacterized protein LOC141641492 [Silene latifolia]|uniref:uncharacterized protein LOC141641492 n=1 Tax=Silene latifolia TaxID=37657 RepID=UPI003D7760DB